MQVYTFDKRLLLDFLALLGSSMLPLLPALSTDTLAQLRRLHRVRHVFAARHYRTGGSKIASAVHWCTALQTAMVANSKLRSLRRLLGVWLAGNEPYCAARFFGCCLLS